MVLHAEHQERSQLRLNWGLFMFCYRLSQTSFYSKTDFIIVSAMNL